MAYVLTLTQVCLLFGLCINIINTGVFIICIMYYHHKHRCVYHLDYVLTSLTQVCVAGNEHGREVSQLRLKDRQNLKNRLPSNLHCHQYCILVLDNDDDIC